MSFLPDSIKWPTLSPPLTEGHPRKGLAVPERGVDRKGRITGMVNHFSPSLTGLFPARFAEFPDQEQLTVDSIPSQVQPSIQAGGKGLQVGMVQDRLNTL